jgi:hypothetical protein
VDQSEALVLEANPAWGLSGVGAALTPEQVQAFDGRLASYLEAEFSETFLVPHRMDAHILVPR